MGLLYELQSQLETMKDEAKRGKEVKASHMETIRINLPKLTAFSGMKPYQGDYGYESLRQYMKEAEEILSERGNKATLKADALMSSMLHEKGKEAVVALKRDNYNINLEDCVIGTAQKRMLDVIDGHIVPRTGIIFLTPESRVGRAPFYSSEKIVGSWHIKTLWFNMAVMLLMCIILTVLLMTDWPGRVIRSRSRR